MTRIRICALALLVCGASSGQSRAEEPNESFAEATILAPGVLSVDDSLSSSPDTVLGIRDLFGEVYLFDDDGSEFGDGLASGLGGVPTNSGSISFVISGYPDEFFEGSHNETGQYEVFVDVFDFFGDPVDSFSEVATLQPGMVDEYSYSDFEWIGGFYNVNIDNITGPADVDFFTFTGLSAGASFTAEVTQEEFYDFDSLLGWFDAQGILLEVDDDDGEQTLSLISGIVPANGQLTFAVTGYGDNGFVGTHSENDSYTLVLTLGIVDALGDFDNDGDADGQDFLVWQRNPSVGSLADWQANYGAGSLVATVAVPEPGALILMMLGIGTACLCSRKR